MPTSVQVLFHSFNIYWTPTTYELDQQFSNVVWGHVGLPKILSGGLWSKNYFHNNAKKLFAFFILFWWVYNRDFQRWCVMMSLPWWLMKCVLEYTCVLKISQSNCSHFCLLPQFSQSRKATEEGTGFSPHYWKQYKKQLFYYPISIYEYVYI